MQAMQHTLMLEMGKLHISTQENMMAMGERFLIALENKFVDLRDATNDTISLVHDRIDRLETRIR